MVIKKQLQGRPCLGRELHARPGTWGVGDQPWLQAGPAPHPPWRAHAAPSPLSCRFGRKPILSGSYLLLAASGSGAAFSPSFSVYMVLRFLCGFSMAGVTLSTVILSEPQGRGQGGTCLTLSQGSRGLARPRAPYGLGRGPREPPLNTTTLHSGCQY